MSITDKVRHTVNENGQFLKHYMGDDYEDYIKHLSAVVEFHVVMESAEKDKNAKLFKYNKNCKHVAMSLFIEHCEKMKEKLID